MMTQKTANMVSEWVKMDGGDVERTAKWMAYTLKLGNIRGCREMIAEALAYVQAEA